MLVRTLKLAADSDLPEEVVEFINPKKKLLGYVIEGDINDLKILATYDWRAENKRHINLYFDKSLTIPDLDILMDFIKQEFICIYIILDCNSDYLPVVRNKYRFHILDITPNHEYLLKYSPALNVQEIVNSRLNLFFEESYL